LVLHNESKKKTHTHTHTHTHTDTAGTACSYLRQIFYDLKKPFIGTLSPKSAK